MVNTGKTTWAEGYQFVWVEGQSLGAAPSVPAPYCPPGQAVDISVRFTTPNEPGDYLSYWRLVDPQGNQFGDKVWTQIQVAVAPASAPSRAVVPELPLLPEALAMAAPLAASQIAQAAALGIIYNSYWLRVLTAAN